MSEVLTVQRMLETTDMFPVDWDALPEAYGLGKLMELTSAMPTVAQVRYVDNEGTLKTWVGMHSIGKEASELYPDRYAAFIENWRPSLEGALRLEPYLPETHMARIAIARMFDESDAIVGIDPTEDQSRFTWPEGDALKNAYDVVRQRITQGYLWMVHPELVRALEGNDVPFKQIDDVAFMTRALYAR